MTPMNSMRAALGLTADAVRAALGLMADAVETMIFLAFGLVLRTT